MQQRWVRFEHAGRIGFGTLEGMQVQVHDGDMYTDPRPTGQSHWLTALRLLTPTVPSKVIALWTNSVRS